MVLTQPNLNNKLTKLKDIKKDKDLHGLSYAVFPGKHCPLMGVEMAVKGINDAVLFIIGTNECIYYTKHMTLDSKEYGGINGRCLSLVLNDTDITFGAKGAIDKSVEELMTEYKPPLVFLVSTCVLELIGEDIDSLSDVYTKKYNVPFLAVHTDHFKCDSHLNGLERTISACIDLMETQSKTNTVNIIGQRSGMFSNTELYKVLMDSNVSIGMMLPSGCDIDNIKTAPKAMANIVLNPIGLNLAKKMKEKFNIPYISFDKFPNPESTMEAYTKLFSYLNKDIPSILKDLFLEVKTIENEAKKILNKVTYIYGNTPFDCMPFNEYMTRLGMKPLVIQTSKLDLENDKSYIDNIISISDPYITTSANIAPLQSLYDTLKPNLYLGHEDPIRLKKKGIQLIRLDEASSLHGFEVSKLLLKEIVNAIEGYREEEKENELN